MDQNEYKSVSTCVHPVAFFSTVGVLRSFRTCRCPPSPLTASPATRIAPIQASKLTSFTVSFSKVLHRIKYLWPVGAAHATCCASSSNASSSNLVWCVGYTRCTASLCFAAKLHGELQIAALTVCVVLKSCCGTLPATLSPRHCLSAGWSRPGWE